MVDTIERLAVLIEANTRSYERAMTKLQAQTNQALGNAGRSANRLGDAVRRAGDGAGNAAAKVEAAGARMNRSFQMNRAHVANLGYQINDITQGLVMGQSPFQILAQQGFQVAQVMGQTGVRSVGGALALVKGSIASLINPVTLATFAVIGLGTALVSWLTRSKDETNELEEALTRHRDLVRSLREAYDDAAKGVRNYGDESASVIETQLRAQNLVLQRQMRELTGASDFARELGSNMQALLEVAGSQVQQNWSQFSTVVGEFWRGLDSGRANVLAFREAIGQLAALEPENQALQELAGRLLDLTQELADVQLSLREGQSAMSAFGNAAAIASGQLTAQIGTVNDLANALDSLRLRAARANLGGVVVNGTTQALDEQLMDRFGNGFTADARRLSGQAGFGGLADLVNYRAPEAPSASSGGGGGSSAAEQVDKIQEAIDALNEERAALHRTNEEQRIYEALARAGIEANHARAPEIIAAVRALIEEEKALERVNDALATAQEITADFLGTFMDGLMQGKSAIDALGEALDNLKRRLLQMALDMAIQRLFAALTQIFTPGVGGIGIGGGQLLGAIFGQRAAGGPVAGRHAYLVGERGPEVFVPHSAGSVRPIAANGNGGGTVVQVINNSGAAAREESGRTADGRALTRIIIGEVGGAMARGEFDGVMGARFGQRPKRIRRG